MTHDQIKELAPLAALDWLEADEARLWQAHLDSGCPQCAQEISAINAALGALALHPTQPSSTERIWQMLEQRLATSAAPVQSAAPPAQAIRRFSARTAIRWRGVAAAALAAALILVIATGFLWRQLDRQALAARDTLAALQAQLEIAQSQNSALGRRVAAVEAEVRDRERVTRALLSSDLRQIKLTPLKGYPNSSAVVLIDTTTHSAVLDVFGLPPAPQGQIYEWWWITAKAGPSPAAIFGSQSGRESVVGAQPPPTGDPLVATAITLEPGGGVAKPSGPMYLKGDNQG